MDEPQAGYDHPRTWESGAERAAAADHSRLFAGLDYLERELEAIDEEHARLRSSLQHVSRETGGEPPEPIKSRVEPAAPGSSVVVTRLHEAARRAEGLAAAVARTRQLLDV